MKRQHFFLFGIHLRNEYIFYENDAEKKDVPCRSHFINIREREMILFASMILRELSPEMIMNGSAASVIVILVSGRTV